VQKGFSPILIVLIIAAAVGGYFVYMSLRGSNGSVAISPTISSIPAPTTKPESTNSAASPAPNDAGETKDWKTYTNINGYTFKYPENQIKLITPSEYVKESELNQVSKLRLSLLKSPREGFDKPSMTIQVLDPRLKTNQINVLNENCKLYTGNIQFNTLDEFGRGMYKNTTNKNCSYFYSVINPLRMDKFQNKYDSFNFSVDSSTLDSADGGLLVPRGQINYVMLEISSKFYLIAYDSTEKIFNQILSTFKFTQ